MKRKFFAAFLSLCMVMSLVPMTALAAPEDNAGTISAPTASGKNFFANGTPIMITASAPAGGEQATLNGFIAAGTDAYISWTEGSATKYVGVNGNTAHIFGGSDGRESAVSVADTSITMTGGTVWNLFGGNYGEETADKDCYSTVEGNVNISLSGTAVVKNLLHGAGARNTCVKGTITMTFDGVDLSNETNMLYVNGGSWGNGNEGTRNIESGAMSTDAVANKVVINATNSKFYLLGGGGSGSTKVKDADVTLTNCGVNLLYLSGINGEVVDSSIVATNCTIDSFSATNRGFVGTGNVDLNGCTVEKLNTGAAEGCFTSDSGGTDGSGVTGSVTYNIDASSTVEKAVLTPYVTRINDAYTNTFQNVTVNKAGDPLELEVASFDAVQGSSKKTLNAFLVPENSTLTLNNVKTTIAGDNTLTNAGTIDMDDASSLTVASGATLEQAGTVNGGTVEGTVTEYVARVGNTGYESLDAAMNAVKDSGGTITLLKDATLDNANYTISKPVTIQGNGTIEANNPSTHAFTVKENEGSLTLNGVTLKITGDSGYGIDVQYGTTLTMNNAEIILEGVSNATISSWNDDTYPGDYPGKFILNNSKITATDIGGNFSNGGDWTLTNSSIEIEGCTSNGFSCNSATLDNSTVSVSGAKLMGVTAKEMTLENNSAVTVEECGTDLPKKSDWATDNESYKHPVEIKKDGEVNIDSTSSMVLQNNADNNNTIYFVESTLDNNGTLQANVVTKVPSGSFSVTVKNGNTVLDVANVTSGETYTLPAALPNQGYNHFVGWSDGTTTYDANTPVKIEKDTTFTAVWSYMPPANPNYKITIGDMENGTVTANPTAAKAGATVTLTPVPDEGYALSTLTVTDRFGNAVRVTENSDGTYTFTMPNGQVTVTATFVETEEPVAEPFIDVAEGDWFYDAVVYAYQNELMDGVGGNRFAPNSETTRAQLVTILYRLEGEPAVSGDLPFTDVEAGIWYTDAILWAAENNIVNGVSDTEFAPGDDLTRQQLVTILYRYAEAKGYDVSASADLSGYPDADQVQDYAQPAMAWAVAENIIQGMEDGTLKPAGNASRAQIATILMRFCEDVAQ